MKAYTILTMKVDATTYEKASSKIISWAQKSLSKYVCVSNVHMCMETFDHENFKTIVNNADMVVPDGKPLVWTQRLLGEKSASQVRGSDLLLHVCKQADQKGIPIGLYGGTPESLKDFIVFLNHTFPNLKIPFAVSPPFRKITEEEDQHYIDQIKASGTKIVFVGIGCPKQENWMAAHKNKIPCVMIGFGAAFDFFSGRKRHAPRWMQKAGLEWAFRLASDPGRLWKRYLKHNPRFIFHIIKQLYL